MRVIRDHQILTVMALAVVVSLVLVTSDTSLAQERKKISWSSKPENSKVTVQHNLEIPDTAGHIIRISELRRSWPDGSGPAIEGRKVLEEINRSVTDAIAGNGKTSGYWHWRFENGDQMFGEYQLTSQAVAGAERARKTTYLGTSTTTGATGAFKGIKALGKFAGASEWDAEGKLVGTQASNEAEYWFEQ